MTKSHATIHLNYNVKNTTTFSHGALFFQNIQKDVLIFFLQSVTLCVVLLDAMTIS